VRLPIDCLGFSYFIRGSLATLQSVLLSEKTFVTGAQGCDSSIVLEHEAARFSTEIIMPQSINGVRKLMEVD
jgi:hypothetical protein